MKRKVDVQYANPFLSRNLGKFEINMFEIVSELAQDRDAKAKLKETGIRKTIDAVNTETEQIRSMLDKVHNRAMLMDEMLRVFTEKQSEQTVETPAVEKVVVNEPEVKPEPKEIAKEAVEEAKPSVTKEKSILS